MEYKHRKIRICTLEDQGKQSDLISSTPSERLGMMWQLAVDAWLFKGEQIAESRLSRHITSILR